MRSFFVTILILALAGIGYFLWAESGNPKPTTDRETRADREGAVQSAFAPTANLSAKRVAITDAGTIAEVKKFFVDLGQAYRGVDKEAIQGAISGAAMYSFVEASDLADLDTLSVLERAQLKRTFVKGLAQGMLQNAESNGFKDPKIRRVERIAEGEYLVYVSMRNLSFDIEGKFRYWLIRDGDEKLVAYDWEDLDQSLRASAMFAAVINSSETDVTAWLCEFRKVWPPNSGKSGLLTAARKPQSG